MTALAAIEALPTSAVLYARISEDRTGREAGVERQEAECRALAEAQGWVVDTVLIDNDISAFSGKRRPAYDQLLSAIDRGEVEAVVVWHPDRLYRRTADLTRLVDAIERQHVSIRTVRAGTST